MNFFDLSDCAFNWLHAVVLVLLGVTRKLYSATFWKNATGPSGSSIDVVTERKLATPLLLACCCIWRGSNSRVASYGEERGRIPRVSADDSCSLSCANVTSRSMYTADIQQNWCLWNVSRMQFLSELFDHVYKLFRQKLFLAGLLPLSCTHDVHSTRKTCNWNSSFVQLRY